MPVLNRREAEDIASVERVSRNWGEKMLTYRGAGTKYRKKVTGVPF